MTSSDKRLTPEFGPIFWCERESEREWHYCPACYRDVPTFRFSEGVVGSGEPVSVIRCCWECGYGIDRLAETDPERVHELVRQREALGAEESS
jgi:hypothetical protein